MKNLCVVLPAYNEATCIGTLLDRIRHSLDPSDLTYLVLVVDDGSEDDTVETTEQRASSMPIRILRHERNSGYGAALQTGLLEAIPLCEVVITMDADDSHDPGLIPEMLEAIESGNDVVIASRMQRGGRVVGVPLHRRLLSDAASLVLRVSMPLQGVRDFTSGYRAYRTTLLRSVVEDQAGEPLVRENGFVAGLELLRKVRKGGARVAEVPLVLRYDRKLSDSRMDVLATSRDVFRLLATPDSAGRGHSRAAGRHGSRTSDRTTAVATAASDLISTMAAFAAAYALYAWVLPSGWVVQPPPTVPNFIILGGIFALISVVVLWRSGQYRGRAAVLDLRLLQSTARYLLVAASLYLAALFLAGGTAAPTGLIALGVGFSVLAVLAGRRFIWSLTRRWQLRYGRGRRVLIYGSGATGQLLMKKIMQAPRMGAIVLGFIDGLKPLGSTVRCNVSHGVKGVLEVPVLGRIGDLESLVDEYDVAELLVAVPLGRSDLLSDLLTRCRELGIDIGFVPSVGDVRADQLRVEDLSALTVLRPDSGSATRSYHVAKRLIDVSASMLIILATLPIWVISALLIRWDSPGPVLFTQIRVGQNGRRFHIVKFRTMKADSEAYSRSPASQGDPRVTRVGWFLRETGADELPQLLNVLAGHMSLVGPRPEMPFIVEKYDSTMRRRLEAKPGVTGIWQLSPDRDQDIHANIEYDLYYIRNRSLTLDTLILGETVIFVLEGLVRVFRWRSRTAAPDVSIGKKRVPEPLSVTDDGQYIFVAADQRQHPAESVAWENLISVSLTLAGEWPVTLLVAPQHSARVDNVIGSLKAARGNGESECSRLEYLEYTSASPVQEAAMGASVVITDLGHVAGWALEGGADLIRVGNGSVRLERGQRSISDSAVAILHSLHATSTRNLS